jgi:hypothetical protein
MAAAEKTPESVGALNGGMKDTLVNGLPFKNNAQALISVICERNGCVAFGRRHEIEDVLPVAYHHGLAFHGVGWRAYIDAMSEDAWEIQVEAPESLPSVDAGALSANILVLVAECERLNGLRRGAA